LRDTLVSKPDSKGAAGLDSKKRSLSSGTSARPYRGGGKGRKKINENLTDPIRPVLFAWQR